MTSPRDGGFALRALVAARFVLGAAAWVVPGRFHGVAGGRAGGGVDAGYPLRLFGVRDAFCGTVLLLSDGEQRRFFLALNVGVDVLDAVAAVRAGRTGGLSRGGSVLCSAASLVGASLGALAFAYSQPDSPSQERAGRQAVQDHAMEFTRVGIRRDEGVLGLTATVRR